MADFYMKRGGQQFGPYKASRLKQHADDGRVLPSDLVRQGEDGKWYPASSVKGLFSKESVRQSADAQDATSELEPEDMAVDRNWPNVTSGEDAPQPSPEEDELHAFCMGVRRIVGNYTNWSSGKAALSDSRLYAAPSIPPGHLSNAINGYASDAQDILFNDSWMADDEENADARQQFLDELAAEEVALLLYDMTVLGGGGSGFLMTDRFLYHEDGRVALRECVSTPRRNRGAWSRTESFAVLERVEVQENSFMAGGSLLIFGLDEIPEAWIKVTMAKEPLYTLAQMLNEVASLDTTKESGGGTVATTTVEDERTTAMEHLRKLKQLHDEGVLTDEEFNDKRQRYLDAL